MKKSIRHIIAFLFFAVLFSKEASVLVNDLLLMEKEEQASGMMAETDSEQKKGSNRNVSFNEECEEAPALLFPLVTNDYPEKNIAVAITYRLNAWPDIPTPPPDRPAIA